MSSSNEKSSFTPLDLPPPLETTFDKARTAPRCYTRQYQSNKGPRKDHRAGAIGGLRPNSGATFERVFIKQETSDQPIQIICEEVVTDFTPPNIDLSLFSDMDALYEKFGLLVESDNEKTMRCELLEQRAKSLKALIGELVKIHPAPLPTEMVSMLEHIDNQT